METYAERLNWALEQARMSQSELARAVGVRPQSIQYLCDKTRMAQGSKYSSRIADILRISAQWLETGKGPREQSVNSAEKYLADALKHEGMDVRIINSGFPTDELPEEFRSADGSQYLPDMIVKSGDKHLFIEVKSSYVGDRTSPLRQAAVDSGKLFIAKSDNLGESIASIRAKLLGDYLPFSARSVEASPEVRGLVPLISWVQAGSWGAIVDNFHPGDAEDWMPCIKRVGPHAFALRVRGVSMEPKYQDGDIIFVDPDAPAEHGRNVVVRLENEQEATFKQLVVEGGHKFLKPLNPDWPGPKLIQINGDATICGVVVGKWVPE